MRVRRGSFPRLGRLAAACIVGAALGAIPAMASSEATPTVKAVETGLYTYGWSPTEVTISSGGQATFANSTAGVPHGLVWTSTVKPSCAASVPDGEGGKETSSASSWSGACTFAAAGTYTFRCYVHPYMTGAVTVAGPTTTGTTTTGTTTETPPTTPTSGGSARASEEPLLAGSAAQALKLPERQRGNAVRGSIAFSKGATGARLQIDLLAQRGAIGGVKRHGLVSVGRLVRKPLAAGRLAFSVRLDRRAREALAHRRRLTLRVDVSITAANGRRLTFARAIVVHV